MTYWKWLRDSLKPAFVWVEWTIALIGNVVIFGTSIGLTLATRNPHYLLLLFAMVGSLLLMAHAYYRMDKGGN